MRDKVHLVEPIDTLAFAKAGTERTGELALTVLPRFASSIQDTVGAVVWSAVGSFRQAPGRDAQIHLHLKAHVVCRLVCQRCLDTLEMPIDVDRLIRFVPDEQQAEQLDEDSEDEDVLALPQRLDLTALIEDELILALPLVPKHGECPKAPATEYADDAAIQTSAAETAHPFAALAALRNPKAGA